MGLLTRFLVVALLAFAGGQLAEVAEAHHLKPEQTRLSRGEAVRDDGLRPGCRRHYRMRVFVRYTKTRYARRDRPLTKGQKVRVKHLALCLANKKKSRWAYEKKRRWRERFRARLAFYRLTPYPGPGGTRWAIPWYIVVCESHGSWSAYNPSGAAGPYQLMAMHGRPFPVRSWRDKMAHHRIASRLWNGGRGRSHWVC